MFTAFGIEFQQKAWSVKLTVTLNFLHCPYFVIESGRVIHARETF
jgi:hypothetical protein